MNNRLYSHMYLHLKNIFTLKKSFTFANHLKKNILRKRPAPLLKNSLWDSFQFLLVQINHLVSP